MTDNDPNLPHGRKRGRPRMQRTFEGQCVPRCYSPQCDLDDAGKPIILLEEEIAALSLVDLQGLEQEEAAQAIGISRKTLWRDLKEARRKVAGALVNGLIIEVNQCRKRSTEGCPRTSDFICPKRAGEFCKR